MAEARNRIGVIQGRLITSATGQLQCSPGERWREEYQIAGRLGLNHIELVAERSLDPANPIWTAAGRRQVLEAVAATGVQTASLCQDETLEVPLTDALARHMAARLTPIVAELSVKVVVLPFYEASDLVAMDREAVAASIRLFAECLDTQVALELPIPAVESARLLEQIGHPRVGICYDTGNSIAFGFDPPAEIRFLGKRIVHVHAKDKTLSGQNVRFGLGATPFEADFAELAAAGYDGLISMEATRGENPVVTAAEHLEFLLALETAGAGQ